MKTLKLLLLVITICATSRASFCQEAELNPNEQHVVKTSAVISNYASYQGNLRYNNNGTCGGIDFLIPTVFSKKIGDMDNGPIRIQAYITPSAGALPYADASNDPPHFIVGYFQGSQGDNSINSCFLASDGATHLFKYGLAATLKNGGSRNGDGSLCIERWFGGVPGADSNSCSLKRLHLTEGSSYWLRLTLSTRDSASNYRLIGLAEVFESNSKGVVLLDSFSQTYNLYNVFTFYTGFDLNGGIAQALHSGFNTHFTMFDYF